MTLPPYLAFDAAREIAAGTLLTVALAARQAIDRGGSPLVFEVATGRTVELDLRGTPHDIAGRLEPAPAPPRPRGRPKLGVVAREVTLLPHHWDWLNGQTGGASVALRKLVEAARRDGAKDDLSRAARDAAYRFMTTLAGDAPGYEAAIRALFAGDLAAVRSALAAWPPDIARAAGALAAAALEPET